MTWKPSNEPTRRDRARVAQTDPIEAEIEKLRLPPLRLRKLGSILNALVVQIEDGGDSPEINRLLLEALRAAVRHQVGDERAGAVFRAIDSFERAEAERWEMVKTGTPPPIELRPEEQLDDLIQEGYRLLAARQRTAACDKWLEAWESIEKMATPDMQTAMDFDAVYPMMQSVYNWCGDLEMELGNAGLHAPVYHEHRVRFVREFLAQFRDVGVNRYITLRRAEGEALWELGRQAEAEGVYQTLVSKFPDEGWAYIGWSDEHYLWSKRTENYEAGEAILLRALERPDLKDRAHVMDRLTRLYEKWGRPERQAAVAAQPLKASQKQAPNEVFQKIAPKPPPTQKQPQSKSQKRGKRKRRH